MWSTTTPLGASHRGSGVSHTQTPHRRYVNGLTIFNRSIGKVGQRVGVSEHGCTWPAPVPKPSAVQRFADRAVPICGSVESTRTSRSPNTSPPVQPGLDAHRAPGVHGFCPNTHCREKYCYLIAMSRYRIGFSRLLVLGAVP